MANYLVVERWQAKAYKQTETEMETETGEFIWADDISIERPMNMQLLIVGIFQPFIGWRGWLQTKSEAIATHITHSRGKEQKYILKLHWKLLRTNSNNNNYSFAILSNK